jgi:hypothetical protein
LREISLMRCNTENKVFGVVEKPAMFIIYK